MVHFLLCYLNKLMGLVVPCFCFFFFWKIWARIIYKPGSFGRLLNVKRCLQTSIIEKTAWLCPLVFLSSILCKIFQDLHLRWANTFNLFSLGLCRGSVVTWPCRGDTCTTTADPCCLLHRLGRRWICRCISNYSENLCYIAKRAINTNDYI